MGVQKNLIKKKAMKKEVDNLVFTEFEEYDGIIPYMAEGETNTYYLDHHKKEKIYRSYIITDEGEVEIGIDKSLLKAIDRVKTFHANRC